MDKIRDVEYPEGRTFVITPEQATQINKWWREVAAPALIEAHGITSGTIGDNISYHFVPTGIGDIVHVCLKTSKLDLKLDISGDL